MARPRVRVPSPQRARAAISRARERTTQLMSQAGGWTRRQFNDVAVKALSLAKGFPFQLQKKQILPIDEVKSAITKHGMDLTALLFHSRDYIYCLDQLTRLQPGSKLHVELDRRRESDLNAMKRSYDRLRASEAILNSVKVQRSIEEHLKLPGFQRFVDLQKVTIDPEEQYLSGGSKIVCFAHLMKNELLPGTPMSSESQGLAGNIIRRYPKFEAWTSRIMKRTLVRDPMERQEASTKSRVDRRAELQQGLQRQSKPVVQIKPRRLAIEDPAASLILHHSLADTDVHLAPVHYGLG